MWDVAKQYQVLCDRFGLLCFVVVAVLIFRHVMRKIFVLKCVDIQTREV